MKRMILWLSLLGFSMVVLNACGGGGGDEPPTVNPSPPDQVTGVTLDAGDQQVTVSWSPVAGATTYNLYWNLSSGVTTSTGTQIPNIASPYDHVGLTNGSTYFYIITAENDAGEGVPSLEQSATPQVPVPQAPGGVTAVPGDGTVTVSWNAVQGADSYNTYLRLGSAPTKSVYTLRSAGSTSPHQFSGLNNNQTYYAMVTAENIAGESVESSSASATPMPGPTAPSDVTAVGGDLSITLDWTPVNGATHHIYWNTTGGVTSGDAKISTVTPPYVMSVGANGVPYYFRVSSENAYGENLSSEVSAVPDAPWTQRSSPVSGTLWDTTYGNGIWLAVGDPTSGTDGTLLGSANGITWSKQTINPAKYFHGVDYTSKGFYALGTSDTIWNSVNGTAWSPASPQIGGEYWAAADDGSRTVITGYRTQLFSDNGTDWFNVAAPLKRVVYGGGKYVAIGQKRAAALSADGSAWSYALTGDATHTMYDIAYGNSLFVAVGEAGTVLHSSDGQTWTPASSLTAKVDPFYGVTYGNGLFVAVGYTSYSETNKLIYYSSDGDTWTNTKTDVNTYYYDSGLTSVAYNGTNQFLAVGLDGIVVRSSDGMTWSDVAPRTNSFYGFAHTGAEFVGISLYSNISSSDGTTWNYTGNSNFTTLNSDVEYGNGLYVAAGFWGRIDTSSDGIAWSAARAPVTNDPSFQAVSYVNGTWIAAGENGRLFTSANGTSWSTRTTNVSSELRHAAYGNGLYAVVGKSGTIITSPDLATWTVRTSTTPNDLKSIYFDGTRFLAGGYDGTILYSTDGITWSAASVATSGRSGYTVNEFAFDGTTYVAVASHWQFTNSYSLFTSTNGTSWTHQTTSTYIFPNLHRVRYAGGMFVATSGRQLYRSADGLSWEPLNPDWSQLIHAGGQFIAVGPKGRVGLSTDGITWKFVGTAVTGNLSSVTHDGTRYIAVGQSGVVETSTDGLTWSAGTSGVSQALTGAASAGAHSAVVGDYGNILRSTDGTTWSIINEGATSYARDVAYGNSVWVAVHDGNNVFHSSDGVNWKSESMVAGTTPRSVAFGGSTFVLVGSKIFTSTDGVNWSERINPTANLLNRVIYDGSMFVAVGAGGTVLTSSDGSTWLKRPSGLAAFLYSVSSDGTDLVTVGSGGLIATHPCY